MFIFSLFFENVFVLFLVNEEKRSFWPFRLYYQPSVYEIVQIFYSHFWSYFEMNYFLKRIARIDTQYSLLRNILDSCIFSLLLNTKNRYYIVAIMLPIFLIFCIAIEPVLLPSKLCAKFGKTFSGNCSTTSRERLNFR